MTSAYDKAMEGILEAIEIENNPSKVVKFVKPGEVAKSPLMKKKLAGTVSGNEPPAINDDLEDWQFNSYHLDYKYTPPPVKGPCCVCNEGIIGSMVTALDQMWCPRCFACTNCKIELRNSNYIGHDRKPYCKTCYNILFLPPCGGCGKEILDKYVHALDKFFHPECFRCTKCAIVLDPKHFFERDGKPYCEHDYHDLFFPKCAWANCRKPILDNKVTAMGKDWHPMHFKCTKCGIVLDPKKFWEKDGRPYCEHDFHDLFSPRCHGCKSPITDKNKVVAMGHEWHPKCFKCTKCHCMLNPKNFFERDNKPYCEKDFHDLFSPKCHTCKQPIVDGKKVSACNKEYHPHCFKCTKCGIVLSPQKYFEKDNNPYCERDFHDLFSPKCAGCKQPITGAKVVAQGKDWHPNHFKCTKCGVVLDPNKFFEKDGLPYCEYDYYNDFFPKCATCNKPVIEKALSALGRQYHPGCFKCEVCKKQLYDGGFYEQDGKAYCFDDWHNLFSPKCRGCQKPIKESFCLNALGSDWHNNCFRCKDCNCLLEEKSFYELNNEPYCYEHYHARMCPDCVKMRRAQDQYFNRSTRDTAWTSQFVYKKTQSSTNMNNWDQIRPPTSMSNASPRSIESEIIVDGSEKSNGFHHDGHHHNHNHSQLSPISVDHQRSVSRQTMNDTRSPSPAVSYQQLGIPNGKFPNNLQNFESVMVKEEYKSIARNY